MQNKHDHYFHINEVHKGDSIKPSAKTLVVFVHYDAHKKVADYVVHYLRELAKVPDFDIIFSSNTGNLADSELAKVNPFVGKIIVRENIGYDFAAFYTGFNHENLLENYERLIFANDSVYAPIGGLEKILPQIFTDDYDIFAPTDSIVPEYHLQPYFGVFNLTAGVREIINHYSNDFRILSDKKQVVDYYELGLSRMALQKNLRLKALCAYEDVLALEKTLNDPVINKLKNTIHPFMLPSLTQKIKAIFSRKMRNRLLIEKSVGDVTLRNWYTLVKYMHHPFIKTKLLKDKRFFSFHQMEYEELIKNNFPDYDINLIRSHLKLTRKL